MSPPVGGGSTRGGAPLGGGKPGDALAGAGAYIGGHWGEEGGTAEEAATPTPLSHLAHISQRHPTADVTTDATTVAAAAPPSAAAAATHP